MLLHFVPSKSARHNGQSQKVYFAVASPLGYLEVKDERSTSWRGQTMGQLQYDRTYHEIHIGDNMQK
jgi:hypothetical protein